MGTGQPQQGIFKSTRPHRQTRTLQLHHKVATATWMINRYKFQLIVFCHQSNKFIEFSAKPSTSYRWRSFHGDVKIKFEQLFVQMRRQDTMVCVCICTYFTHSQASKTFQKMFFIFQSSLNMYSEMFAILTKMFAAIGPFIHIRHSMEFFAHFLAF